VQCRPPDAWAVARPTLHGEPVRLLPVRATPYNGTSCTKLENDFCDLTSDTML